MNKARRTELARITEEMENLKQALDALASQTDDLQAEEQEAFDNLPEGLQAADQGQRTEAMADALAEAKGALDEAVEQIQAALDTIEAAE